MSPDQRILLADKVAVWRANAAGYNVEMRDYNQRCADALDALMVSETTMLSALKQALYLLQNAFDPPSSVPKASDKIIPQVRAAIEKATGQ